MSQPNEGQDRLDYQETADITEVHASILREHAEPVANSMPIPTWLGVLCAGALCWAGVYVGLFNGGFSSKIYNEYESSPAAFFPLPGGQQKGGGEVAEMPLLAFGEKVYGNRCVACHQASGLGGNGVPPLVGSEWVDGSEYGEKRMVALILKGMQGPVTVKGVSYNALMPNWDGLKDREIAGVITYIRQAWGNKGTGEITEAQVKAAKKEFMSQAGAWKVEQLKAIPTDAKLDGGGAAKADAPKAAAPVADVPKADAPKAAEPTPGAGSFDLAASIAAGKTVYMQTCLACHQPTGMGIPGAFPPVAATEFVNGDQRRLVAITLKGIQGPLKVNGVAYAAAMPNLELTYPLLKDDKNVADVLNYVRNNFTNKNDAPITPDLVGKVRKEFAERAAQWTEQELLNFPPAK